MTKPRTCSQCHRPAARGRTRCRVHLDRAAAWKRERADAGLCHCGAPVMRGRRECHACLTDQARHKAAKRRARLAVGLCIAAGCRRPPERGHPHCGPHAAAQAGYVAAHRRRTRGETPCPAR